ncbi:MAG: L-dopachrome tautomerase-related protein [Parasphingorhabdus sp.]|uniref:L-dopachrome tautomerase-related protein n=1 Tax=Parasphingorhabdus sp. TaxID=2709688 RepID=UPI0032969E9F
MLKWTLRLIIGLAITLSLFLIGFRWIHGSGEYYPDMSTVPTIEDARVTTPILLPYPPGMVASSPTGRIFYTYHMLHKPERFADATIFEWKNGKSSPFPNAAMQKEFHGAMGITIDRQSRFWIIKPGALEGKKTRLMAVDMTSGKLVVDHYFAEKEAGFAQDMRVSPDGNTVYLADTGLFKFTAAGLIIFDVPSKTSRTALKGHSTVSPQNWLMRKTNGDPYKLAFGLLSFVVGVDGIALTPDGETLYFATMSHDSVFRIPTEILRDKNQTDKAVAEQIEFVGKKPMSDGIELTAEGDLIITDVENGGIGSLSMDGTYTSLTKSDTVDWADSVTVDPDGAIWFTDSRLTDLIDQFATPSDEQRMKESGPYAIYRIAPLGAEENLQ